MHAWSGWTNVYISRHGHHRPHPLSPTQTPTPNKRFDQQKKNSRYADGKVAAGVERNRQGMYHEAIKQYEQALATYPAHVDALVAR